MDVKILVMGDSHSKFLNVSNEMKDAYPNFRGIDTKVISLSGATISGFGKRESTLSSREKFYDAVGVFKPDYICFALGQVDLELGYYYKTIVKNKVININDYVRDLSFHYFKNVISICEDIGFPLDKIIFKGVNLSTLTESRQKAINYTARIISENITDKGEISGYTKSLKDEFPVNSIRNMVHNNFNFHLKKLSIKNNSKYFDVNNEVKDKDTGNIRKEFLPAFNDHHLVDSLYVRGLHLQKILDSIVRG